MSTTIASAFQIIKFGRDFAGDGAAAAVETADDPGGEICGAEPEAGDGGGVW